MIHPAKRKNSRGEHWTQSNNRSREYSSDVFLERERNRREEEGRWMGGGDEGDKGKKERRGRAREEA